MSTDVRDPSAQDGGEDPIKQIKGEMNRKLEKTEAAIQKLTEQNAALLAAIQAAQQPAKPKTQEPEKKLSDIMYEDPERYAAIIREDATREATKAVTEQMTRNQEVQATVAALAADYPELADSESELVKSTLKILEGLPANERNSTTSYKYAVREAAHRLDVKPRTKRDSSEDFMAPGGSAPSRRKSRSDAQVIESSKDMASVFGLNLEDPKAKAIYLDILKKKGAR